MMTAQASQRLQTSDWMAAAAAVAAVSGAVAAGSGAEAAAGVTAGAAVHRPGAETTAVGAEVTVAAAAVAAGTAVRGDARPGSLARALAALARQVKRSWWRAVEQEAQAASTAGIPG